MPIILATQEVEIRRITVWSQPRKIVLETLSQKILHKNRAGGVAQGGGPEFKLQYHKKERKKLSTDSYWVTELQIYVKWKKTGTKKSHIMWNTQNR
jgi:hypothetical protein